ncbi:Hos4 protein [Saccharomycopsis crataegensis]|uniref:Hos4 protein n=1 Tax=Saccharomycopsis crataegensis TaxID=43959 RepID=A0AAV5QEP7_9ASCO|nr:Hos4 protein [Saccharomycopsis crataegensis]
MAGGEYNKKDHYKPYSSSYHPSYSNKNGGIREDKRSGNGPSPGLRPYSSASPSGSFYGQKRSMFPKPQGGSHYSGSSYVGNGSGSGGTGAGAGGGAVGGGGGGGGGPMFPKKRYNNTYTPYNPNRSRSGGSVYISDANKSRNNNREDDVYYSGKSYESQQRRDYSKDSNEYGSRRYDSYRKDDYRDPYQKKQHDWEISGQKTSPEPVIPTKGPSDTKLKDDKKKPTTTAEIKQDTEKINEVPVEKSASEEKPQQIATEKKPNEIIEKKKVEEPVKQSSATKNINDLKKHSISSASKDHSKKNLKTSDSSAGKLEGKKSTNDHEKDINSKDRGSSDSKKEKFGTVKLKSSTDTNGSNKHRSKSISNASGQNTSKISKMDKKDKQKDSDPMEKKKQKVKEVVKKFELNKDPKKKHSLFKDTSSSSSSAHSSSNSKTKTTSSKKSELFKNPSNSPESKKAKSTEPVKKHTGSSLFKSEEKSSKSDAPTIKPKIRIPDDEEETEMENHSIEKSKPGEKEKNQRKDSGDHKETGLHKEKKKSDEHKKKATTEEIKPEGMKPHTSMEKHSMVNNDKVDNDKSTENLEKLSVQSRPTSKDEANSNSTSNTEKVNNDKNSNAKNDEQVNIVNKAAKHGEKSKIHGDGKKNHDSEKSKVEDIEMPVRDTRNDIQKSELMKNDKHSDQIINHDKDDDKKNNYKKVDDKRDDKNNDDEYNENDNALKPKVTTPIENNSKTITNDEELNNNEMQPSTNKTHKDDNHEPLVSPLRSNSYIEGQRSSPLSEINSSQDHVSADESQNNDAEEDYSGDETFMPSVSRSRKISLELEARGEEDLEQLSDIDRDDYPHNGEDDSDTETVIADYPPKSRRGRGRLVRKSEYETSSRGDAESSRSRERPKKPSSNSRSASGNRQFSSQKKTRTGRDASGRSKLQRACDKGKFEIAEELLEEGADVNDTDYAGNSSLHEAALKGHYRLAKLLIDYGADVNMQSGPEDLDTPLIDAAANGHYDVVELLLENGANPNICNALKENVYELLKDSDDPESRGVLKQVLKKREEFKDVDPVSGEDDGMATNDTNHRNDLFWMDLTSRSGRNEIYKKTAEGDYAFVGKYLSGGGSADTDTLIIASRHGHLDIVSILLGFGAEVNGIAEDGSTALMHAVGRSHLDIVKLLLDSGADPSMRRESDGKNSVQLSQESELMDSEEVALLKEKMPGSRQKSVVDENDSKKKESKKRSATPMERSDSSNSNNGQKIKKRKQEFKSKKEESSGKSLSTEPKHKEPEPDVKKPHAVDGEKRSNNVDKVKKVSNLEKSSKFKERKTNIIKDVQMKTSKLFSGASDEKDTEKPNVQSKTSKLFSGASDEKDVEKPNVQSKTSKLFSGANDEKDVEKPNVQMKTSKLFSSASDEKDTEKHNADSKKVTDIERNDEKKNSIPLEKLVVKIEKKTAEKSDSNKKEAYEQQKAEKIKARQQAVLLQISQAEKEREKERELQRLREAEQRKKDEEEAIRKEKIHQEQLAEEKKQKEIATKRKIRENYPYCLQTIDFYDYDCFDDLEEDVKTQLRERVLKYLPLYYIEINGEKWVVDLQINLLTGLTNIYDKFPNLNDDKMVVKDHQQEKLWSFFSSILMRNLSDYNPQFFGSSSSSSSKSTGALLPVKRFSMEKKLEALTNEGKKFQSLMLCWVKLSLVESEIFSKNEFLAKVPGNLVEIDQTFLENVPIMESVETQGAAETICESKHIIADNLPRRFRGRPKVLDVVNATKKNMW